MTSVVADTHTLIWYVFDLQRLSQAALTALEQAVNTITFALTNLLKKLKTYPKVQPQ
ncbi:hypothetical protein [Nostoc sp.]|uniref:hypothetical protein n=1 Tax=Nostoc sp. TaxID=1180 RepID=UPI002FF51413